MTAARRTRADADARSRTAEQLARFAKKARSVLGPAGGPALAERTETLRREWVADTMVTAGRARAASLGWPDAYALTKALGEVALTAGTAGTSQSVSIVRPSIIESALEEPTPGWIRGFRMAEPIILSYARGLLDEFPGVPEGVIDVIPVDLVVSGILAAVATPGDPAEEPRILQVASGEANPLRYQVLVDNVRDWFLERPLHDEHGQPIMVPDWSFPGRGRVERQLRTATSALAVAEKAVLNLPLRGRAAEWGSRLEARRNGAERALEYVELYGAYTECEAVYGIEGLLELAALEAQSAGDATMPGAAMTGAPMTAAPMTATPMTMDPRVIDWDRYISEVHLPSVVTHGQARTTASRRDPDRRSRRLRAQVLDERRQLAAFDLENTLIASNVVATYAWLAGRRLGTADRVRLVARLLAEAPSLLAADRADRSDFLRSFYRRSGCYQRGPGARVRNGCGSTSAIPCTTELMIPAASQRG